MSDTQTAERDFSDADIDAAGAASVQWLRQRAGLTPGAMAAGLGLALEEWRRIENGEAPLTLAQARRIAPLFRMTPVQFCRHVESVLTGEVRAALEVDMPHTGGEETMNAIEAMYAAMQDPETRRNVKEFVLSEIRRRERAAAP